MARPRRNGLLYFSFDTDFFNSDKRIKGLKVRYGSDGVLFYIWILCESYKEKGYYLVYDDDCIDSIMSDLNLSEGFIKQVMAYLVSRSLLTELSILAGSVTVITSPGIQKRYQEAVKSQKRDFEVDSQIWLLNREETATCIKVTLNPSYSEKNPSYSEKNPSYSEKNPIKEKKVNKKKINNTYSAKALCVCVDEKKKSTRKKQEVMYFEETELNNVFKEYIDMRKKIKKPMTDRAIQLSIKKLHELATKGDIFNVPLAISIVEQTIFHNWLGLFPLKSESKTSTVKKNSFTMLDERKEEDFESQANQKLLNKLNFINQS